MPKSEKQFSPDVKYPPFKEEPTIFIGGKVSGFEHDRTKVVRHVSFDELEATYKIGWLGAARKGKELLEELKERYHIPIPLVGAVIGKKSSPYDKSRENGLYIVTEKIDGVILPDMLENTDSKTREVIAQEVDNTYVNLLEYAYDKYRTKDSFFWDISDPRQFMWGRKPKETSSHLYMIDADIQFTSPIAHLIDLFVVAKQILSLEKDYKITLYRARNKFSEILKDIDTNRNDLNHGDRMILKEFLKKLRY